MADADAAAAFAADDFHYATPLLPLSCHCHSEAS
jgi:hypothetical protein